jgi:1-acyl-sn-glycerol-3-phosphate acyltransferase
MSPFRHLVSTCSLVVGLLNLTFWCVPLLVIILIRALVPAARSSLQPALNAIYRNAVRVNDWWFRHVLGYAWQPPNVTLDANHTYLVIANHQSWADSFLIQAVIVHNGHILKVLVKEELTRWPILGLIFKAYDFPRLKRRAADPTDEPERRRQDADRIRQACEVLKASPAAMLIYPEGTRFTPAKHAAAAGPYDRLLPPRPGGFATVLEALSGHADAVLDIDIYYPDSTSFWQFLSGGVREPEVRVTPVPVTDIEQPAEWLAAQWHLKDGWLESKGRSPRR